MALCVFLFYACFTGVLLTVCCTTLKFKHDDWQTETSFYIDSRNNNGLICETNVDASFTWLDCYSDEIDPMNYSIYHDCEDFYAEKQKFCKIISQSNLASSSPSYQAKSSRFQLHQSLKSSTMEYVTLHSNLGLKPRNNACIFCIANSTNATIRVSTQYKIIDCCNAPPKDGIGNYESTCHRKNPPNCKFKDEEEFKSKCQVGTTKFISIEQSFNSKGERDVIFSWEKPIKTKIYGNKFVLRKENGEETERCIITIYDDENTYCDKNGQCRYNLANISSFDNSWETFTLLFSSLPYSKSETFPIKPEEASVLCEKYERKHNVTLSRCLRVTNVQKSKCDSIKSVKITWDIDDATKKRAQENLTIYWSDRYWSTNKEKVPIVYRSFTFTNVTTNISVSIVATSTEDEHPYYVQTIVIPACQDIENTPRPKREMVKSKLIIQVVLGVVAISIIVFSLFLFYAMKKVKKDIRKFNRLMSIHSTDSGDSRQTTLLQVDEDENTPEKSAMIVYPGGCYEVDKIVLWLASHFQSIGISPLVDQLQAESVGKNGWHNVLLQNFEQADYIVALFTEEKKKYDLPCHTPFRFIMDELITQDNVYHNRHRCLAISFQRRFAIRQIPAYLFNRLFVLPSDFEKLILSLLGIGLYARSVFERILRMHIANAEEKKKELKLLVQNLNAKKHPNCHSDTCKKGMIMESDDEELEFASSLNNNRVDPEETESLFHSMSSSNEASDSEEANMKKKFENILTVDLGDQRRINGDLYL